MIKYSTMGGGIINAESLSKVGSSLVRRCGTRDPFRIADELGIEVLFCEDIGPLKGMYKVIKRNRFIFINQDLSERMQRIARLYERYATGSLDKAKYITFKEDESRKHASYCSEISRLEMMISNLKKDERKSRKVARTIFQARKETKLSAEVIKELIERIDVISKTEIEIHLYASGKFFSSIER